MEEDEKKEKGKEKEEDKGKKIDENKGTRQEMKGRRGVYMKA